MVAYMNYRPLILSFYILKSYALAIMSNSACGSPDENAYSVIELAEVQWVKNEWIKIELLLVSPKDQARLRQFVASAEKQSPASARIGEQIMIRA